ncbi:MAG: hypothetical protein J6B93_04500, partial [Clostridia bacterium]|nr:hypothetical protein [Clostridia bacterium]
MKKLLLLTLCLIFAVAGPCLTVSAAEYPIQKEIDYVKNPVVLDGKITEKEWGKPIFGGDPTKTEGFSVPDGLDTSQIPKNIEVYVCWDNDNFYVGAVVEYKSFWNGHKHQDIWMGDSLNVDICVAEDNQDSRWRTVNGYSDTEGRGFSYITAEPDAHQKQYEWITIERGDSFLGETEITKNGNTVVYECTFPWS